MLESDELQLVSKPVSDCIGGYWVFNCERLFLDFFFKSFLQLDVRSSVLRRVDISLFWSGETVREGLWVDVDAALAVLLDVHGTGEIERREAISVAASVTGSVWACNWCNRKPVLDLTIFVTNWTTYPLRWCAFHSFLATARSDHR